ncbi:MAG TPA: CheR family methyltransferase [Burkholderiaceae bacterium]|jgi:chemotaxis protein methyltransferase CheR
MMHQTVEASQRQGMRFQAWIASALGLRMEEWQLPRLSQLLDSRAAPGEVESYLESLERGEDAAELDMLCAELTLGESYFFRHGRQFELLRSEVLPSLIAKCVESGRGLRVLSMGCATGEEPYSLAILLADACRESGIGWQIEAQDLCARRLQQARAGRYGDWSLRATPGAMRRQWFTRQDGHYEILPELRERVRFSSRNLSQADPDHWREADFDLVFCRNVLGSLEPAALERSLNHLALAVRSGGYVFLGNTETLRSRAETFAPRGNVDSGYYERLPGSASLASLPRGANRAQATRLTPTRSPLWPRTGRDTVFELWRQERLGQALHLADSLMVRDRSDTELLLAQTMLLIRLQRLHEAQRLGVRLLALATTPAMGAAARHAKALGHEMRGELAEAEQGYRHAARLDPEFAMPHLRLALMARRQQDSATAQHEMRRAHELLTHEDERRLLIFGDGCDRRELLEHCRGEMLEELV